MGTRTAAWAGGSHKLALIRDSQTKLDQPARTKTPGGRFSKEGVVGGEEREKTKERRTREEVLVSSKEEHVPDRLSRRKDITL